MKALVALAAGALLAWSSAFAVQTSRQEDVARKGATVMPFDLMRTTHFFDDTKSGGIETITARDPGGLRRSMTGSRRSAPTTPPTPTCIEGNRP